VNKLIAVLPIVIASFSVAAFAGELSNEDRSELRQRADAFQAERARNPDYQPGEGRLNRQSADAPPRAVRTSRKGAADSAKPDTRRHKAAKKARSLKNLPGAFVRKKSR
jgi:hypothetical protein